MPTKEQVMEALRECMDPEIQVDIVALGLVYRVEINSGNVRVDMTMTTPMCPYADRLLLRVKDIVEKIPGISSADVRLVWDPPWQPSDELKAMLGIG